MTLTTENAARQNMLKSQILTGNVLEASVLDALMSVERGPFVPRALQNSAYIDEEIPLGGGRFLMEPLSFARMLEHAAISAQETVLCVACGAGYGAAVISKLAQKVVALEEDKNLAAIARGMLVNYPNIEFVEGPLVGGASNRAPYDVIVIEGAVEMVPQALGDQLREDGRLVAVEHDAASKIAAAGLGKLVEYRKLRGVLYKTTLRDASVTLLAAFRKPAAFAF